MKRSFDILDSAHIRFIHRYAHGESIDTLASSFEKEGRKVLNLKKDLKNCLLVDCDFEMIKISYELNLFDINKEFKQNWREIAFAAAVNAYFSCRVLSYKNSNSRLDILYKKSIYMYRKIVF